MSRTRKSIYLSFVRKEPTKWKSILSTLEFEVNATVNASTGLSPFETDIERVPKTALTRSLDACTIQSEPALNLLSRLEAYRIFDCDNMAAARSCSSVSRVCVLDEPCCSQLYWIRRVLNVVNTSKVNGSMH